MRSRNWRDSGLVETAIVATVVVVLLVGFIGGFIAVAPSHKPSTSTPPNSTPAPTIVSMATTTHPLIITGTQGGVIAALDETDGKTVWRQNDGPVLDSMVRTADMVYVAAHAGDIAHDSNADQATRLTAFNAATGAKVWEVTEPESAIQGYTYMYVDSGVLVVASGYGDGTVYGLDALTGKTLWRDPGVGGLTQRLMGATGGIAYLANQATNINAFDIRTGKFMWTYETHTEVQIFGGQGGLVYFVGSANNQEFLLTIDTATGTLRSRLDSTQSGYPQYVTPDGTAYAAKDDKLCAFRVTDGTQLWCVATNEREFQALGALFVFSPTELLYSKVANGGGSPSDAAVVTALNRATGKQLWSWQGPSSLYSATNSMSLVGEGNTAFLATSQGMYAFRISDGKVLWHALETTSLSFVWPAVVSQAG